MRTAKVWKAMPPITPMTMTPSSPSTQPSAPAMPCSMPVSMARPSSQGVKAAGMSHVAADSVMTGTTHP